MLRIPLHEIHGLFALLRRFLPQTADPVANVLKGKSPELQLAINAVMTDGVLIARPALLDRLSLFAE
jgi:hypothetical protein